jgi:DNA-binding SARP family transcriptional activator
MGGPLGAADRGAHLVEIQVLGATTVRLAGKRVRIGDAKHRLVLAILVAAEGRLVSTELLIDEVWGSNKPQTARELIHSYISDLRRCLWAGRAGAAPLLPHHEDGGYRLQVDVVRVDLLRFRDLCVQAQPLIRHDDARAAALLREALSLWGSSARGNSGDGPFADLNGTPVADCRWLEAYRHALREERRVALVTCLEAELRLGSHERLIAELANLTAGDPRDERIAALLLTAYYRSGRQDQAVRAYLRTRECLRAELGVEPGQHLRELYERILRQDPRLDPPAEPPIAPGRTQETVPGREARRARQSADPDLPAAVAGNPSAFNRSKFSSGLSADSAFFQGRDAELAEATSYICQHADGISFPAVCVVSGMAGVGKTAFVARVARAVAAEFPDGCMFLDLHGYTCNVLPLRSSDALDRLLRRLGLTGEQIPVQMDERSARFRALLTGQRMLLILDNALSAEQVRPLLPSTADIGVLITSRHRLLSLDDAHHLPLNVLTLTDAMAVFTSVVRACPLNQKRQLSELAEACGRLPLALRIIAARCRGNNPRIFAQLFVTLRDERLRLDEIDDGDRVVTAAFHLSYQAMTPQAQRVFALLGLYPGADWTVYAAAALAGLELPDTFRQLEQLLNASLIEQGPDGRYRFHDLLGSYAARRADLSVPAPERTAALCRLLTWAHDTLTVADTFITPYRYRFSAETGQKHRIGPCLTSYADAYAWISAEHSNLAELCHQSLHWRMFSFSWKIAYDLRGFYFVSKLWEDWISTHRTALNAALMAADAAAEGVTRNNLGLAFMETGNLSAADEQFMQAHVIFEQLHDNHGICNSAANHAAVLYYRGNYGEALDINKSAYDFYRLSGNDRNAAITLRSVALIEMEIGRLVEAMRNLDSARRSFVALNLPLDETMAMNCLGEAHLRSGNLAEAERWSQRALDRGESCGSAYEQARAYRNLGKIAVAHGNPRQTAILWHRALAIYTILQAPEAAAIQSSLALIGDSEF